MAITLLALPHFWVMGSFDAALFYADHFLNISIMNLLSLWLVCSLLFYNALRPFLLTLLFICVLVTSLSDPCYLACFTAPMLLSLSLLFIQHKRPRPTFIIPTLIVIIIASITGYIILRHLAILGIHVNYNHIVFYKGKLLKEMLLQVIRGFVLFFKNNFLLFLVWACSWVYLLLHKTKDNRLYLIKNFILFSIFCGIGAMLFFDPDINPLVGLDGLNQYFFTHVGYMIYFPIFLALSLMIETFCSISIKQILARYSLMGIFICQILILIFLPSSISFSYLFASPDKNWPWLICINQAKTKYHLQAGITGYWDARPIMLFADLPMIQVSPPDLTPYYWLTNTQSFNRKYFNFVVIGAESELTQSQVMQKYGPATTIAVCPSPRSSSPLELLIYSQGITYNPPAS